jgi:hypothetical protein
MTYETSKPSKPNKREVDMSPQAVTARLRMASDLRELCISLGKSRPGSGDESSSKNSKKSK